jgi:hypothetical protein
MTARRKATPEQLTIALLCYEFSPDPKFVPHAATWLNGERWLDVKIDLAADPYGIGDWLSKLPRETGLWAGCYDREAIVPILWATGWLPTWRGPLDVMGAWLRDGYLPDSITSAINIAVSKHGARASLKAFNGYVRHHAERFAFQAAAE